METIFVTATVVAFIVMMLSLLWPKKNKQKKIEPVIVPQRLQTMRPVVDTADERQLARQLFTALRDK